MHNDKDAIRKNGKAPEPEAKPAETSVNVPRAEYERLKEAAGKSAEYWDRLLRLQADFDNARKRQEKERQEFGRYANEGLIQELLTVLDDLERAINLTEAHHQDPAAFMKGVEMVLAHLYEMLKRSGVRPIEAVGKAFDPHCQEVLMQVPDDAAPEHTVLEELQKGYYLYDRVLRTAKVKVSKKVAEQPAQCPRQDTDEQQKSN